MIIGNKVNEGYCTLFTATAAESTETTTPFKPANIIKSLFSHYTANAITVFL